MLAATKYLFILFLLFSLIGCAAHSRYNWSSYDTKMYKHYKNPAEREDFVRSLKEILDNAEPEDRCHRASMQNMDLLCMKGNTQQAIFIIRRKQPNGRNLVPHDQVNCHC